MAEKNKKQNSIYSMTLFNKVISYISPGGGSRSLFIEMIPVDSEYRARRLYFYGLNLLNILSL